MTLPRGVHLARNARDVPRYQDAGWQVVRQRGGATKAEALTRFGGTFDFPGWYGRNLDALWDCLTDLTDPTALVWAGWEPLAVSDPESWAEILGVLRDRADVEPPFAVWFLTG